MCLLLGFSRLNLVVFGMFFTLAIAHVLSRFVRIFFCFGGFPPSFYMGYNMRTFRIYKIFFHFFIFPQDFYKGISRVLSEFSRLNFRLGSFSVIPRILRLLFILN